MNKKMIFNHYANILDDLIEEYDFFKYYFQNPFSLDEDVYYGDFSEALFSKNHLNICCGATRNCLIDEWFDWVVKFNNPEDYESGSCEDEVNIYAIAKANGMEKYFAEPIYLGEYTKEIYFYNYNTLEYNMERYCMFDEVSFYKEYQKAAEKYGMEKKEITIRIPLYAFPRAERYDFYKDQKEDPHLKEVVSKSNSPLNERSTVIGYAFAAKYGEEEFIKFSSFLEAEKINDIHTGNIMMRNGDFILTDYAGYND